MTRSSKPSAASPPVGAQPGTWPLQDAEARYSELVSRVRGEGPQPVTVGGRDEVAVISAEAFRQIEGDRDGSVLVAAMQAVPDPTVDLDPPRGVMPVRDVIRDWADDQSTRVPL